MWCNFFKFFFTSLNKLYFFFINLKFDLLAVIISVFVSPIIRLLFRSIFHFLTALNIIPGLGFLKKLSFLYFLFPLGLNVQPPVFFCFRTGSTCSHLWCFFFFICFRTGQTCSNLSCLFLFPHGLNVWPPVVLLGV